jgi:Holliday junction resolvase RusA-like endonuclease
VLRVGGDPVGQGAIRRNQHGAGYHANGHILKPWRAKVQAAAIDATGQHAYAAPPKLTKAQKQAGVPRPKQICQVCQVPKNRHGVILGAVRLEVIVTFARPKTDPNRAYPIGHNIGDWDHHGRSVSDALTGVVFADDAQIIDGRTIKTYPGGHPLSLAEPGAVIRIWEIS